VGDRDGFKVKGMGEMVGADVFEGRAEDGEAVVEDGAIFLPDFFEEGRGVMPGVVAMGAGLRGGLREFRLARHG